MRSRFRAVRLLALTASACSGDGGGGESGGGEPGLVEVVQAYCPWVSRCEGKTVLACAGDTAATWPDQAAALREAADCLADAVGCADHAACTAGLSLTPCGTDPDGPECGVSGACAPPTCTSVNSVSTCVDGVSVDVSCGEAGVSCVEQTATGFFCE